MNDLLAAVDALTKPDILTRFTGVDHDHDWLELVRVLTREERDAMKQANANLPKKDRQKIPRTVKTGEWWCPWHDTPMVVTERPEPPEETINRHDDAPLLDQLEARIGSTLGDRGTSGVRVGGSPIDLAAFSLHRKIDKKIREWMTDLGATPGKGLSLAQLLRSWYTLRLSTFTPVGEDDRLRVRLDGWQTEIRDILDPPEQIPYRGQACPICGETRVVKVVEGDAADTVALWAFLRPAYRDEGSYGVCRACDTVLARDADPIMLRQKMNGTLTTGVGAVYQTATRGADE